MTADSRPQMTTRLCLGLMVNTLGVVVLLGNLGFIDARQWLRYWPVVFIAVGILKMAQPVGARGPVFVGVAVPGRTIPLTGGSSSVVGGLVWVVVGVVWLLKNLGYINVRLRD